MKNKKLKRLSRAELLELLLSQTQEAERLKELLDQAEAKLSARDLQIREAGNLAEAVLRINKVMESTQAAAQQYLDNIVAMEKRAKEECEAMIMQAREEAEQIRKSAQQQ